ncbi:hypothetical protein BS47DRAFT_1392533 [Hydnum rufescens UP504]|uniref:Uncharacterized protein n=1 Tax=Hydnum rufescens UP504 TaxID=1448309 RepID=A0A9P6AZV3_9AGAM|nr:hypothetical protein BS47DRAFT_1392533 [Hydnum rufescens UP504]
MVWIVFDVYRGIRLSLNIPFQIPLSALRHSALYPNPLAIPWDLWSKDIYFLKEGGPAASYKMSGGRLIDLTCSSDSHCTVSLFDLNRSRAGVPVMTRPDSSIDDDQSSHLIKSDVFPLGEISIKQPRPVYVASRSLSLGEYIPRFLILDDERIMIWARRDPEAPGMTAEEHRAHKLIVLSF